jgi:TonB family protein
MSCRVLAVAGSAFLLAASPVTAQEVIHVRAPLVDYLIAGDTAAHRVRLITTLSMVTAPAPSDEPRLTDFDAQPVLMFQWATVERRLLDSLGRGWHPKRLSLIGLTLDGLQSGTYVGVGADPAAPKGRLFFFMIGDTAGPSESHGPRHGWRLPVTFDEADTLLGALHVVARDVTYRTLTIRGHADGDCPAHRSRHSDPAPPVPEAFVETPPRLLTRPTLVFPPEAFGRSGIVTVQFVIDTAGHADPESVCVVSSTDEVFTAEVLKALAGMRFAPGTIDGRSVRVLVEQPFSFSSRY